MNNKTGKYPPNYLIILFLIVASGAIIQANYAMIFHIKATIVSYFAVILTIIGAFSHALASDSPSENHKTASIGIDEFLQFPELTGNFLIWFGITVYTLNFWFILFMYFILNYWYKIESKKTINNFSNQHKEEYPPQKIESSIKNLSLGKIFEVFRKSNLKLIITKEKYYWLLIAGVFVYLDALREYTVWHVFTLRMFPFTMLILVLFIAIIPSKSRK